MNLNRPSSNPAKVSLLQTSVAKIYGRLIIIIIIIPLIANILSFYNKLIS